VTIKAFYAIYVVANKVETLNKDRTVNKVGTVLDKWIETHILFP